MNILITGAAGYIASHFISIIDDRQNTIVGVDNFINSYPKTIELLRLSKNIMFYECDIRDKEKLNEILKNHQIDLVYHFAALKYAPESEIKVSEYIDNNINGSNVLLQACLTHNIKFFVFSGSAAVYDESELSPINENSNTKPKNIYGFTKLIFDQILEQCSLRSSIKCVSLRYFNPIGSHPSLNLEDNPKNTHYRNIIPNLLDTIQKKQSFFGIYGNDYKTSDGSCIRDYIHIMDLIDAHSMFLNANAYKNDFDIYNVGTGKGTSVIELVQTFENKLQIKIPIDFKPRRKGDVPILYTHTSKLNSIFDWNSKYSLDDCVENIVSKLN